MRWMRRGRIPTRARLAVVAVALAGLATLAVVAAGWGGGGGTLERLLAAATDTDGPRAGAAAAQGATKTARSERRPAGTTKRNRGGSDAVPGAQRSKGKRALTGDELAKRLEAELISQLGLDAGVIQRVKAKGKRELAIETDLPDAYAHPMASAICWVLTDRGRRVGLERARVIAANGKAIRGVRCP